ncbi:MAG: gliding motility lipoprotein GldH [Bacteroidota bacterium]
MKRNLVFVVISSLLLTSSCDKNRIFEEYKTIPNNTWFIENKINFDVDISDIATPKNIYVNIRNSGSYPYSNLFIFLNTTLPNNSNSIDTLECTLADASGKWLGNGLGDIWDNKILFKKNFRFPQAGKYHFEMAQGMRINPLPLIADVGLRIETAK